MHANNVSLVSQAQAAEVQLTARCAAMGGQGRQQHPAQVPAGPAPMHKPLTAAPTPVTGPAGGLIWPHWSIFHPILLWDKPRFTSIQLHSPERLFLLTAVFFSLSNTCHDTWPSSFLPPSNFHSSNFCCLHSKHNLSKIFQHWAFQLLSATTDFTQAALCK